MPPATPPLADGVPPVMEPALPVIVLAIGELTSRFNVGKPGSSDIGNCAGIDGVTFRVTFAVPVVVTVAMPPTVLVMALLIAVSSGIAGAMGTSTAIGAKLFAETFCAIDTGAGISGAAGNGVAVTAGAEPAADCDTCGADGGGT